MKTKLTKYLTLTSLLLAAPSAWAETIDCTPITTLPYVITTQGIYCLTGDLATSMTSGNAIEIQTNNVTIDLNGWKLGGLAAGAGAWTSGIYAYQRKNITIRNGTIRGFAQGIYINDASPFTTSQGHLIEDIRADKNTWIGMQVRGRGNIVRRNQVLDTGGSTLFTYAYGIYLFGPGVRALNNDISSTAATDTGNAFGLLLREANGAVVEGNRIDDVSSGTGNSHGMYIESSFNAVMEDNRINGVSSGSGNTYGMYIELSNNVLAAGSRITSADNGILYSSSSGKYKDNLTSGVTTPFTGGIDAGGNN